MKSPIYSGKTDTGLKRDHNEDSFEIIPSLGFAIVADGMGAHNAGEVASQIAVGTACAIISQTDGLSAHDRLETVLQASNASILEKALTSPRYRGMGTTVVATLLSADYITVAHVGDSRLYQLRKGRLSTLTKDHSLQQDYVDKGLYTPAEAKEKVARNILTRALGLEPNVQVDINEYPTQNGDRYLLCSDGLYEMLNAVEITAMLSRKLSSEDLCDALIELANAKGGKDNITVIIIDL
jgi:serine/threonine protein phosphatase PrpC